MQHHDLLPERVPVGSLTPWDRRWAEWADAAGWDAGSGELRNGS